MPRVRAGWHPHFQSLYSMDALQDFTRVWKGLESVDCQRMSLVWETQELLALNSSIVSFLKDQVCSTTTPAFVVPDYNCESNVSIMTALRLSTWCRIVA